MIRRAIVVLLALAGLSTLAVGIVSYRHGIPGDALWINTSDTRARVRAAVIAGIVHVVYCDPDASGLGNHDAEYGPFYARRIALGGLEAVGVGGPFWAPAALLLAVPCLALLHGPLARRRRRKRGRCIACGYDLTGLAEPRCPECGRPFTPRPARTPASA